MSTLTFDYVVRDASGKNREGSVEAANLEAAQQQLRREGWQIVQLVEETPWELIPRRVGKNDIIYATAQLAVMVDTGITLAAALGSIADQCDNPTFKVVLNELRNRVEGGEDFSSALARHPHYFDRTYVALIKASEHTGSMAEMLETLSDHMRKQLETRQKVQAALAYPMVMLVVAIGVTVFLLTFVLPKFAPLFNRKGIKLPSLTVFMMALSDALRHHWYFWLAGAVAVVIGFLYFRKTPQGRQWIDWCLINLPIIGPLNRKIIISRSLRTLGTMVQAGVSVLDAIRLAAEVSSNIYYEQIWLAVLEQITQGHRICEGLTGKPLFPPSLVQMIGAGEETGKLDHVLKKVSNFYDREVETSIKATTSLIEPLMICGMGVIVGCIAMGLLLPIFQLSRPSH